MSGAFNAPLNGELLRQRLEGGAINKNMKNAPPNNPLEPRRWKDKIKMKIYDPDSKRILKNVTLFLTPDEAAELGDSAKDLSEHPEKHHHHVSDAEYKTEVTVSVYTDGNVTSFDEESRRVLQENE